MRLRFAHNGARWPPNWENVVGVQCAGLDTADGMEWNSHGSCHETRREEIVDGWFCVRCCLLAIREAAAPHNDQVEAMGGFGACPHWVAGEYSPLLLQWSTRLVSFLHLFSFCFHCWQQLARWMLKSHVRRVYRAICGMCLWCSASLLQLHQGVQIEQLAKFVCCCVWRITRRCFSCCCVPRTWVWFSQSQPTCFIA